MHVLMPSWSKHVLGLLFAGLMGLVSLSHSVAQVDDRNKNSTPESALVDDKERLPFCPARLHYIHANVYYYTVIDCSNGSIQPFGAGYSYPVETGCESNQCLCSGCQPLITTGSAGKRRSGRPLQKIKKDMLENAMVYLTFRSGKLPPELLNSKKVAVINGSNKSFFVLTEFEFGVPPGHPGNKGTFLYAHELDFDPTALLPNDPIVMANPSVADGWEMAEMKDGQILLKDKPDCPYDIVTKQ